MAHLHEMLATGEKVILVAHRHIVFLLIRTIPLVIGALVLWVLAYVAYNRLDTGQTIVTLLLLAVSLVPLANATYRLLSWQREQYVITNYRIIQLEGLINKRTIDSSLEKVNDVQMVQRLFGRIFGYGDINVMTGSEIGVNQLYGIADPFQFKRALQDAKHELGDDDNGRRFAATPVQAAAGAATGQHTASAGGIEAARLMAALVDLRDSGVISAAEYEERRDQLLQQR